MGSMISLTAADGHTFGAYRAGPEQPDRALGGGAGDFWREQPHEAGLRHIRRGWVRGDRPRAVRSRLARRGVGLHPGRCHQGARAAGRRAGGQGDAGRGGGGQDVWRRVARHRRVLLGRNRGVVGAPRSTSFKAAVGWYGGGIAATKTETPHCPVQLHFGEADGGIPLTDVEAIRAAQPSVEIFVYPGAGHGFGCDDRGSFNSGARDEAQARTLAFFGQLL